MWYRTLTAKNKNLRLVLAQVKEQLDLILKGDPEKIAIIKEAVPESKYQPAAAYFLNQGAAPDGLTECFRQLGELDSKKKVLGIQASKKGVTFNNQPYTDWLKFSEAVHGLFSANDDFRPSTKGAETDIKPITTGNNITVTRAKTPADAAQLGIGTTWCISDARQGMFDSYRNSDGSTFYFLVDKNPPEKSPLRRTVVNMTANGPQITDLNNTSGTIGKFGKDANRYLAYLHQKGVDTSVLKNDPLTLEEVALNENLSVVRNSPDRYRRFLSMPAAMKSAFIGRAYKLNPDELKFIADNNLDGLINQYLNVGHPMSEQEFSTISKKRGWVDTYARKRRQYLELDSKDMTSVDAQLVPDIYALHKDEFEEKKRQFDEGNLPFSRLPIFYRGNTDFARKAWENGGVKYPNLPVVLKDDIEFSRQAWESGKVEYSHLPAALRNDIEIARKAWEAEEVQFGYLPAALKNDLEFSRKAWESGQVKFAYLPEALRNDVEFSRQAWESGRVSFWELPYAMMSDIEIARKALESGKADFTHLPQALKNNIEIARRAWDSGKVDYYHLPASLTNDLEFALMAWESGRVHFAYLPGALKNDIDFALKAYEAGKVSFDYLPQPAQLVIVRRTAPQTPNQQPQAPGEISPDNK